VTPTKPPTAERPLDADGEPWPPRGLSFEDRPGIPKPYLARWREPGGRKKSRSFEDTIARDRFAKDWIRRKENWGKAAPLVHPRTVETWRIFDELTGGHDPLEIARFWLKHRKVRDGVMPLADAVARFLEIRAALALSGDTTSHLQLHMDRLLAAFPGRTLGSITADDLRAWLTALAAPDEMPPAARKVRELLAAAKLLPDDELPMAGYTLRHHLRSAGIFFGRAVKERWIEDDPTEAVEEPKVTQGDIHVLSVADAERLFATNKDSLIVGRLALEAFAGLRYTSAARISAAEILTAERGLVMPGSKHKSGRRHYVDGYPKNLWKWLEHAPTACWEVTPRMYLKLKSQAFERAKVQNPGNVLRHSFCSYHIAQQKDAARTAVLLTHRSPAMLYQHYKGRATQADAQEYFAIAP
jgi:hypothetical protein